MRCRTRPRWVLIYCRTGRAFLPKARLQADAAAADEPMASDNSQRLLDFAPHEPRNALVVPAGLRGCPFKAGGQGDPAREHTFRPEEPRARSNTTGSYPDLSSVSSETTSAAADEGLVPMTPRILPGGGVVPVLVISRR